MEPQRQYVGIDLHRRRSVIVRRDSGGEVLGTKRIDNDPAELAAVVAEAGHEPEVVLEAEHLIEPARLRPNHSMPPPRGEEMTGARTPGLALPASPGPGEGRSAPHRHSTAGGDHRAPGGARHPVSEPN